MATLNLVCAIITGNHVVTRRVNFSCRIDPANDAHCTLVLHDLLRKKLFLYLRVFFVSVVPGIGLASIASVKIYRKAQTTKRQTDPEID